MGHVDRIRQFRLWHALTGFSVPLPLLSRPRGDTDASRKEDCLLASYQYRGHIIRIEVEQNPVTLYWEAKGIIELIGADSSRTFSVSGAIKTFKTEAEAKQAFLQQAKRWIYNQIGS